MTNEKKRSSLERAGEGAAAGTTSGAAHRRWALAAVVMVLSVVRGDSFKTDGATAFAAQAPPPTSDQATAAPPPTLAAAAAPPAAAGIYLGPTTCGSSSCHGSVVPHQLLGIRQDEYFIWQKQDLHARAYGVLFNDRSRVIARRLHLASASGSQVCLNCHSLAALVPARQRRGVLELEDGISCEGCHGAASGWFEGHRSESWTHQRSVAAGMTDLRALEVRAAVCLSCHLGSAGQAVDHELIAAGHPRLAFELDNYSEAMPSHWLPFADRLAAVGERDTHGARAWAVGQAAAFRAGLEQLTRRARGAGGEARWPDLADLSCDSCHHSLAQERWRTEADRPGRPGTPRWNPAAYAVLRLLVAMVAPERQADLDAGVESLAAQLDRPVPPPAEVAAAAERLSREMAALLPRLDQAGWGEGQLRRMLAALADDQGGREAADYQAAQQAALAVQTLVSQLQANEPNRLRAALAAAAEGLAADLQNPYAFDSARFEERLAQLGRQLRDGR